MKHLKYISGIIFLSLLSMGFADIAMAQSGASAAISNCPSYVVEGRVFSPIVQCITDVTQAVSTSYLNQIVGFLRESIIIAMAIAVALLGIKIAMGSSNVPAAESYLLIIKIAAVSYFVLNSGITEYLGYLNDFTAGIADVFIKILKTNQVFTIGGDVTIATDAATPQAATVTPPGGQELWHQIDFLFQRTLGLNGQDTSLGQGVIGIAMILAGLFTLGPMGGWSGAIALFAMFTLLGAFASAIFSFIVSMLAVMLLGAFSPIAIPMILFTQTKNMFEKWLEQLLSYALQPAILTAFLVFMLSVMENGAVDMLTQYNDFFQRVTGPNSKNYVTVVSTPQIQSKTSKPGLTDRDSFREFATKFVAGKGYVYETNATTTKGFGGTTVDMPIASVDKKFLQEFSLNLLLTVFLSTICISFIRQLPTMVQELIGDRTIPNLVDRFGRPVFSSAMRMQDSVVAYFSKT